MTDRVPFDIAAYEQRVKSGGCFVCGFLDGVPGSEHEVLLYDDGDHVAFLGRYPTLRGHTLVVRRHVAAIRAALADPRATAPLVHDQRESGGAR